MIEISDGRNSTYRYRKRFAKLGLVYTGYSWRTENDALERKLQKFCSRKGLKCRRVDEMYVRSTDYRRKFFELNKGYRHDGTRYHCVYCGKRLTPNQVRVDHIIPIYGVQTRRSSRRKLSGLGADDVNDIINLVPACERCNKRKDANEGLWVLRAIIGKDIWLWRIFRVFEVVFVVIIMLFIFKPNIFN